MKENALCGALAASDASRCIATCSSGLFILSCDLTLQFASTSGPVELSCVAAAFSPCQALFPRCLPRGRRLRSPRLGCIQSPFQIILRSGACNSTGPDVLANCRVRSQLRMKGPFGDKRQAQEATAGTRKR